MSAHGHRADAVHQLRRRASGATETDDDAEFADADLVLESDGPPAQLGARLGATARSARWISDSATHLSRALGPGPLTRAYSELGDLDDGGADREPSTPALRHFHSASEAVRQRHGPRRARTSPPLAVAPPPLEPIKLVHMKSALFSRSKAHRAGERSSKLYGLSESALSRRRAARLWWWILVLVSLVLVLWLVHLPLQLIDISKPFDHTRPLVIDTYGCDVHIEPAERGAPAEVRLQGLLSRTRVSWQTLVGQFVYYIHARSEAECERLPFLQCAESCLVTVLVPPGIAPHSIHIAQDPDDPNPWLQLRATDVTLKTLIIRGREGLWFHFTGPTIDASLRRTTITDALLVSLSGGSFRCDACTIHSTALVEVRSQAGSVYLDVELPDGTGELASQGGAELLLNWRQPMNYVCVSTELNEREVALKPTAAALGALAPAGAGDGAATVAVAVAPSLLRATQTAQLADAIVANGTAKLAARAPPAVPQARRTAARPVAPFAAGPRAPTPTVARAARQAHGHGAAPLVAPVLHGSPAPSPAPAQPPLAETTVLGVAMPLPSPPLPPPSPPPSPPPPRPPPPPPSPPPPAPPPSPPPPAPPPSPPPFPLVLVRPPGIYPSHDPWLLCSTPWFYNLAYDLYDTNKDAFVDRSEFVAALELVPYCCGGNCPFASWCDPLSWKIFPSFTSSNDASFAGRAGVLTNSAFLQQILAYNLTGLVPHCRRRLSIIQLPPEPITREDDNGREDGAGAGGDGGGRARRPLSHASLEKAHGNDAWAMRAEAGAEGARRVAASGAHEVTDAEANAGMVVDAADDGAADAADADADTDAPTSAVAAAWPIELVNVHAGRAVPQRRLNARAGGGGAHASPSPLPSPSPPPPPPALWSAIDASSGQIHIAVRARNSSWTPSRGTSTAWPPLWPNDAAQYYAPVDRFSGIQIHQADAKMLQKQVGPLYGDLSSLGQGYIVFDVPAAPGVPRSLWVYTTAPVYHILQPALLAHLSLGTLVPTLLRFRVRFHNPTCDGNLTQGTIQPAPCAAVYMVADSDSLFSHGCSEIMYADHEERLAAIYQGLSRAIKSDGKDTRRTRGELLLVGPERPATWWALGVDGMPFTLAEFTSAPGSTEHHMVPRRPSKLSYILRMAVLMSFLSALIVAISCELALYHGAREVMRRNWKGEMSRLRVLQNKGLIMDLTDALETSALRKPAGQTGGARAGGSGAHVEGRASTAQPSFNVFQVPLVFISAIVIAPLRRRYTPSFRSFVRNACTLDSIAARHDSRRRRGLCGFWRAADARAATNSAADAADATASGATGGRPSTPFSELISAYEIFCFQRDLDIENSRDALQRALIGEFNCRVSVQNVIRYQGICWKDKGVALHSSSSGNGGIWADTAARNACGGMAPEMAAALAFGYEPARPTTPTTPPPLGLALPPLQPPALSRTAPSDAALPPAAVPAALSGGSGLSRRPSMARAAASAGSAAALGVPPAVGACDKSERADGAAPPSRTSSQESMTLPPTAEEAAAAALVAAAAAAHAEFERGMGTIRQFVSERCELRPGVTSSYINAETLSDGAVGFGAELRAWCAARGTAQVHAQQQQHFAGPPTSGSAATAGLTSSSGCTATAAPPGDGGVREPTALETRHALAAMGVVLLETRHREVFGLALAMRADPKCSCGRFWMEGVSVLAHFWLLVAPGLCLLSGSMYAQDVFAMTTATRQPLLWQHAFQFDRLHAFPMRRIFTLEAQILLTVRMTLLENLLFVCATAVHMLLHYADTAAPPIRWVRTLFDPFYGALLGVHVLLLLLHVCLNVTWMVLAAILDPTNFLPAGTAVVVMVFVVVSTKRELSAAAAKLRKLLSVAFETRLQETLRKAKAAIDSERRDAQMRELGLTRALFTGQGAVVDGEASRAVDPAAQTAVPTAGETVASVSVRRSPSQAAHFVGAAPPPAAPAPPPPYPPPPPVVSKAADTDAKLLPSDVFALLAPAASSSEPPTLSMELFTSLFERLDLQLSDARREQLFAYLDITGDGRIDQKEFEDGWDFLVEAAIEEAADSLGISDARIAIALIALVLWLSFLFTFIFLAIQGWFSEGSFESTVQSLFICVSGGMTKALRKKTSGESSQSLTETINAIMKDSTATAAAKAATK